MSDAVRKTVAPIASLKLTVVLFALSIFIVFVGTLAQIDKGIWTVVHEYFRCAYTWIDLQIFFPRSWNVPGRFPFPGGWLIGALLLVNILAAHLVRFKVNTRGTRLVAGLVVIAAGGVLTWLVIIGVFNKDVAATESDAFWRVLWRLAQGGGAAIVLLAGCILAFRRRAGIVLLHAGIILLLVHELFTGLAAQEGTMRIEAGQSINYVTDGRVGEIAVIDRNPADHDQVAVVPHRLIEQGGTIRDPKLPFDIEIVQYASNSSLIDPAKAAQQGLANPADAGTGLRAVAIPRPNVTGVDMAQSRDMPFVYARLIDGNGQSLGTYLLSPWLNQPDVPRQLVHVGGKTYDVSMRFYRSYRPYSIELIEFRHDTYVGTDTPKNFSSLVRLADPQRGIDRTVKIWMNNPLRYAGETFYQSSYEPGRPVTVLQVVRNDGWMLPYLSCMIVAAGMLAHFGNNLVGFLRRRVAL